MVRLPPKDVSDAFTGERFIPSVEGEIAWEHLHRYAMALALCEGLKVVDIACGEGYGSYLLSQRALSVTGVDIDESAVRTAAARYRADNLHFKTGSCSGIPLEPGSVDVVVSFETIEHVQDPDTFLREVLRVLKPDGMLIISSPERANYNAGKLQPNKFHVSELSEDELLGKLRQSFRHVQHAYQSVVLGSLVSAAEPAGGGFSLFGDSQGFLTCSPCLRTAPYVIAACSNRAGGIQLPSSFFDSGLSATTYSSLKGALRERDESIKALQSHITDLEHRLVRRQSSLTSKQINWLYQNLDRFALERAQLVQELEMTLAAAAGLSDTERFDLEAKLERSRNEAHFLKTLSGASKSLLPKP